MRVFTINPSDGWQPGERAYCVRGTTSTRPSLEAGKVYRIASVIPQPHCVEQGLVFADIDLPVGFEGISSGRFVKLRRGKSALLQIAEQTTASWFEAYRASTGQAPRP